MGIECSPCYLMDWELKETPSTKASKIIQYYEMLNDLGKHEAVKRVEELTFIPQYTLELKAAHNDYIDEEGELEKIKSDLSILKKKNNSN